MGNPGPGSRRGSRGSRGSQGRRGSDGVRGFRGGRGSSIGGTGEVRRSALGLYNGEHGIGVNHDFESQRNFNRSIETEMNRSQLQDGLLLSRGDIGAIPHLQRDSNLNM